MDINPVFYVHFIICAELISISCNPKSTSWKSHMIVRYPYQTWEKPPKINIILFSAYLASQEMKIWLNQFPLYTSVQETSHRFINTVFFPFFAFYPHCNTFYSDSNCWKMSCLLYIYIYMYKKTTKAAKASNITNLVPVLDKNTFPFIYIMYDPSKFRTILLLITDISLMYISYTIATR